MTDTLTGGRIAYGASLDATRDAIRSSLMGADAPVAEVTRHLASRKGKSLRAALLLASAAGPDGTVPSEAVSAAAAIELLHLATLVHDDVVDDAMTRRGQPSVQGKFGRKLAVLSGDYLFCRSFAMVAGITKSYPERFEDFSKAMTRICLGEIDQLHHNRDINLTIAGYLRIIAGKTAALFALASYSGAILAGEKERPSRAAGRFGYLYGMMFQILDDCLDYEDDGTHSKKTSKNDLAEGVITPPLIYSMAKDPRIRRAVSESSLQPGELRSILADVISIGGVKSSRDLAGRFYRKICDQLGRIDDVDRRVRLETFLSESTGIESLADPSSTLLNCMGVPAG